MPVLTPSSSFGQVSSGCPVPTDDFSSYTLGAFPQGSWTLRENTGPGTSNIIASSTPFPTQQLELDATTGALCVLSHTYDAVTWMNGTVQCKVASNNPSTANVQSAVIAQFVDTSNFLEMRLRLDTASGLNVILFEEIAGTPINRGSFTVPGGYSANTVYTLNLDVSGTNATCTILDPDCEPLGTVGVNNGLTFTITGGNTGPAGVKRISLATAEIFYDDFYSA